MPLLPLRTCCLPSAATRSQFVPPAPAEGFVVVAAAAAGIAGITSAGPLRPRTKEAFLTSGLGGMGPRTKEAFSTSGLGEMGVRRTRTAPLSLPEMVRVRTGRGRVWGRRGGGMRMTANLHLDDRPERRGRRSDKEAVHRVVFMRHGECHWNRWDCGRNVIMLLCFIIFSPGLMRG